MGDDRRCLHILNGGAVVPSLTESGLPGTAAVWADVLHEGPVPREHGPGFRAVRGAFHGATDGQRADSLLDRWDAALDRVGEYEEVVLWFEHDLFDQLLLLRHLDWFSGRGGEIAKLRLICIGAFPGIEPFHGLGQLDGDQLASLWPRRRAVTAGDLTLGRQGWEAFTGADPFALQGFAAGDTTALPFVAGAVVRLLEDYPAVGTGLGRTERQILTVLTRGVTDPGHVFAACAAMEERVFMGDSTFWDRVRALTRGARPLVTLGAGPGRHGFDSDRIEITEAGQHTLVGRLDWMTLGGWDRWVGGVHLTGTAIPWRWDGARNRLVTSA